MTWIFTFILLVALTVSGEETQKDISALVGSTIYLSGKEVCRNTTDTPYELQQGGVMIGWYENGKIHPRGHFMGRLKFDEQNCTFILRNLSLKDAGMYTIIVHYSEKDQLKTNEKAFKVKVLDHVTSTPLPTHAETSQSSFNITACNMGIPAVSFSSAPLMNVFINLLDLFWFWPGGLSQDILRIMVQIRGILSLVCQVICIGFWISCGILKNSVWFGLAVGCTAILVLAEVNSRQKCVKTGGFGEIVKTVLIMAFYFLQLGFTALVVMAFYLTDGKIIIQTLWALPIFAVIYLVVLTLPCIVYHFCLRPKRTDEEADITEMEKMNPSENGSSINKAEIGAPLPA